MHQAPSNVHFLALDEHSAFEGYQITKLVSYAECRFKQCIRRTQLLLPPTLKVAKLDFENRESLSNLPMKEKVPLGYRTNLDHWQVAHRFAVQNLILPPFMPVAKVTEYVYYHYNDLLSVKSEFDFIDAYSMSTNFFKLYEHMLFQK